jgi:hypothetical protein
VNSRSLARAAIAVADHRRACATCRAERVADWCPVGKSAHATLKIELLKIEVVRATLRNRAATLTSSTNSDIAPGTEIVQ